MTDPRVAAELELCDINAHRMHSKAVNEAASYDRPMSWMFWQWNKDFTSWVRVRNHASHQMREAA